MIRTLLIVTGFGTAICLVALTAAASLVGHKIDKEGIHWTVNEDDGHVGFHKDSTPAPEPVATATLTLGDSDSLSISAPVTVTYTQGPTASVTATGPKSLVDRLRLENGRLYLVDGPGVSKTVNFTLGKHGFDVTRDNHDFTVTITSPKVQHFDVDGTSDLTVNGYDQKALELSISGAGHAQVTGRTDALDLDISGMGDADLGALKTTDADISISGAGNADVAATGKVSVDVSGTGDVHLKTKPASLSTDISGAGSVDQE
ncbi:MAG: DUF2807 domain-containing protein [Asticcacaulis sp.]|nr:DUF2807 domain-containing protein [Asticcacaulis sp.]